MKKLILASMLLLCGLSANAATLQSLAGTYATVGGEFYCRFLKEIKISVNQKNDVTITIFQTDGSGSSEVTSRDDVFTDVNSEQGSVRNYINGSTRVRNVFGGYTLKTQETSLDFLGVSLGGFKDTGVVLQIRADGNLNYTYTSYSQTCVMSRKP